MPLTANGALTAKKNNVIGVWARCGYCQPESAIALSVGFTTSAGRYIQIDKERER
jgi:hypothetical protein